MIRIKKVLPAHAGVILIMKRAVEVEKGITRTCGGDPMALILNMVHVSYYPHMRG